MASSSLRCHFVTFPTVINDEFSIFEFFFPGEGTYLEALPHTQLCDISICPNKQLYILKQLWKRPTEPRILTIVIAFI